MKKVRFQSPKSDIFIRMDERECHSPRPFIEKQVPSRVPDFYQYQRILPFSSDPVQRHECSDSSPYPMANKTKLIGGGRDSNWKPNHELDLSMLDTTSHEPRQPFSKSNILSDLQEHRIIHQYIPSNVLTPIDNNKIESSTSSDSLNKSKKIVTPPNVLSKDDGFFIRRDNLDKYRLEVNPLHSQLNKLSLNKENDPLARKAEIMTMGIPNPTQTVPERVNCMPQVATVNDDCRCHHCIKVIKNSTPPPQNRFGGHCQNVNNNMAKNQHNFITPSPRQCFPCDQMHLVQNACHCGHTNYQPVQQPQNAVDKKTWAIEKFEQNKINGCMDVEKQCNVKEKREPTVADLFKIIKLQNEQLQLLQEKVDKFISTSNHGQQNVPSMPIQNYMSEHVALQTIDNEQHKISIGVMTSFEMVRTSTVINKEILKQTTENAQIQCNRSQISIKEVISKSQPTNLNFLDGIFPMSKTVPEKEMDCVSVSTQNDEASKDYQQSDNVLEEKTLNELSLYNVQVDNSVTPLISPEQTLYLDVRDYSDSESGSDDQSNVGWTYYNKVMTHVNGMLQDSDMPSSASALCRNTRQQCLQMQIDKTNVSVTKRVKFGDDPLCIQSTDTSLKMNQLAAKYLNVSPQLPQHLTRPTTGPTDMSFGTRNYMERHKLLQGRSTRNPAGEMPRFLDITALKQQSKLL